MDLGRIKAIEKEIDSRTEAAKQIAEKVEGLKVIPDGIGDEALVEWQKSVWTTLNGDLQHQLGILSLYGDIFTYVAESSLKETDVDPDLIGLNEDLQNILEKYKVGMRDAYLRIETVQKELAVIKIN